MNEIVDKMEIVDRNIIENLDLWHNVSIISELNNNKILVSYNGLIDGSILELYNNNISLSSLNKTMKSNKKK